MTFFSTQFHRLRHRINVLHCLDKNTMHKKSSKVDVNVLPFHLVLYLILLYLIVNPKSVFANGKLSENFLVNGKNEKVFMSELSNINFQLF